MWSAGIDPMFSNIDVVFDSYYEGCGTCNAEHATREELESALKRMGLLRELTQTLVKDYLLVVRGSDSNLTKNLNLFEESLRHLVSGWSPDHLPAPITQVVADSLFDIEDGTTGWFAFKEMLSRAAPSGTSEVPQAEQMGMSLLAKTQTALDIYITAAWGMNQDAPGARPALSSSQLMLLDKMVKDVLLVSLGQAQVSRISASIQTVE